MIPAMGVACAAAVAAFGASPWAIGCAALAGAALAGAIRMLTNDSPAALTGACVAALLAVGLVIEQHHLHATGWIAIAALGWTIAELARTTRALPAERAGVVRARSTTEPMPAGDRQLPLAGLADRSAGVRGAAPARASAEPSGRVASRGVRVPSPPAAPAGGDRSRGVHLPLPPTSPVVALLPAIVATVLEPAFASLLVLAGIRMVRAPWQRPRWVVAVPIAGALVVLLALVSGLARGGALGSLATAWYGEPARAIPLATLAHGLGESLGPLVAVTALAGLALVVRALHRGALAELAIVACTGAALLIDLRAGAVGPATLGLAALATGLAVARFAAMIRMPSGQAVLGATCGLLLLVAPAYTALLAR